MNTIKRIDVRSSSKVHAGVMGLFGLIAGVLYFIAGLLGFLFSGAIEGLIFGILSLIFAPIIYILMGFVVGALVALVYNLVANKFGGIKIELAK